MFVCLFVCLFVCFFFFMVIIIIIFISDLFYLFFIFSYFLLFSLIFFIFFIFFRYFPKSVHSPRSLDIPNNYEIVNTREDRSHITALDKRKTQDNSYEKLFAFSQLTDSKGKKLKEIIKKIISKDETKNKK